MEKEDKDKYSDFDNVQKMHDELIPEEFPEGSFGSPINATDPVSGKSTPWEEGQQRQSPYSYPDEEIHEDLPRQAPGAYPLHDQATEHSTKEEE